MIDICQITNGLHTTDLGAVRVIRNLNLPSDTDVIGYVRALMKNSNQSDWERRGKNFYFHASDMVFTVHAHSFTLITAHKR